MALEEAVKLPKEVGAHLSHPLPDRVQLPLEQPVQQDLVEADGDVAEDKVEQGGQEDVEEEAVSQFGRLGDLPDQDGPVAGVRVLILGSGDGGAIANLLQLFFQVWAPLVLHLESLT